MKRTLAVLCIAGICLALASLIVSHRKAALRAAQQAAWDKMKADRDAELNSIRNQARTMAANPIYKQTLPASMPGTVEGSRALTNRAQASNTSSATTITDAPLFVAEARTSVPQGSSKKGPLKDPLAREALSFVGFDPQAEAIWAEAINNPDLPANERKDLIEDLNEDGFPDPKNITQDDLPLILSRLALIEDYAGEAMDPVNWDAFMEAYKDLVKMYARLAGL